MKALSIIIILLTSISIFGQMDSLKTGSKWIYDYPYARMEIDSSGNKKITHSSHRAVFKYYEGLAEVQFNKHIGFVDSNKIVVIPLIYDEVSGTGFKDSRAIVTKDGRTGVIDTAGNIVIPLEYDGRLRYDDSLFYVVREYDWGYLDRNGKIVLPIGKHERKCFSCKITYDEILKLKGAYHLKDSLENSTTISKEKAINIAKRKGYYWEGEFPYSPKVNLDSGQWTIRSSKRCGVTYKGNCKHTNGCIVIRKAQIIINAETGKITDKSKSKSRIAIYE